MFIFKCSINEIEHMYECKSLEADLLLKWSKLLEYDLLEYTHSISLCMLLLLQNLRQTAINADHHCLTSGKVFTQVKLLILYWNK